MVVDQPLRRTIKNSSRTGNESAVQEPRFRRQEMVLLHSIDICCTASGLAVYMFSVLEIPFFVRRQLDAEVPADGNPKILAGIQCKQDEISAIHYGRPPIC